MISIKPAADPRLLTNPKIGLAIAGGGPLGAIYAFGALRALEESLVGVRANTLDAYVGVSSGAFLASQLANQYSTADLYNIFIESRSAKHPFRPGMFYRPARHEFLRRLSTAPGLLYATALKAVKSPLKFQLTDHLSDLANIIPAGLFDNNALHEFLHALFLEAGKTNDFRKLKTKLSIVAVDLDTGQSVRFGSVGRRHVPISKAVQASAALPGLYPPVEIDGRHYVDGALRRTLHASVALDAGADIVFAINPLVPFDSMQAHRESNQRIKRLSAGGLPTVLSQTFRSLIQSRMQIGIEKYDNAYQHSDLVLIEPNRSDAKIFLSNVLSYAGRKQLSDYAYRATRQELRSQATKLNDALARHGLQLDESVLKDKDRSMADSFADRQQFQHPAARHLADTLDALSANLKAALA